LLTAAQSKLPPTQRSHRPVDRASTGRHGGRPPGPAAVAQKPHPGSGRTRSSTAPPWYAVLAAPDETFRTPLDIRLTRCGSIYRGRAVAL